MGLNITKQILSSLGINLPSYKTKESTQEYVPAVDTIDEVIVVKESIGYRYIKILEIEPINLQLKSDNEQDLVLSQYADWLKTSPDRFQIKVITLPTDVSRHIITETKALEKETEPACQNAILNHIDFLTRYASENRSLEQHYYLIFQYEKPEFGQAALSESEIIKQLNETAANITRDFNAMGNQVFDMGGDFGIAEFLYNHYNRNTCKADPFVSRVERYRNDTLKVNDGNMELINSSNFQDLIAPRSLDFLNKDYMVINGMYATRLYIKADYFPDTMYTFGWLYGIMGYGYGFDTDIYFFKNDANEKLSYLQQNIKFTQLSLNTKTDEHKDAEDVRERFSGAKYLRSAINAGEDVFDMVVIVTIYAKTKEDLYRRKHALMRSAKKKFQFGECRMIQEDAFFSTSPYCKISPRLFSRSKHNITTRAAAAAYPYVSYQLSDKNGIILGINKNNSSLVTYDQFNTDKYPNGNMMLLGTSGFGKTYALLTILMRLRYHGVQCFVLTPDKQDEFRRVTDAVGGTFVDVSTSSTDRINVFDIRPMEMPDERLLSGVNYKEQKWRQEKLSNIRTWLKYLIKEATQGEIEDLVNIASDMYEDFGITEDNNSIYADLRTKKLKKMPIIEDFYNRVIAKYGSDNLNIIPILKQFVTGAARALNGQTNVDLDNKFIVFGLQHLSDEMLTPTLFIVLEYVWAKCRQSRINKKVIAIDEGWQLISGDDNQVNSFVQDIFKKIRGYAGGAIFATQSIKDLFSTKGGEAILSCSHSSILLGMKKREVSLVAETLGLSDAEVAKIIKFNKQGDSLLCAGDTHIPMKIVTSKYEHDLFTTDRRDLERIASEKENQN